MITQSLQSLQDLRPSFFFVGFYITVCTKIKRPGAMHRLISKGIGSISLIFSVWQVVKMYIHSVLQVVY